MQTSGKGMKELAQVDKQRARVSSAADILASTAALIAALTRRRVQPITKFKRDRCGNILISGKNRENSAREAGCRGVMRAHLQAKRMKAKRRLRQERVAAGGVR